MKFHILKTDTIDPTDRTFQLSSPRDLQRLEDSIRAVGILSPLIVQKRADGAFRLVTGFRRFACLVKLDRREFPALVFPAEKSELELFEMALEENLSVRPLNPIEISTTIRRLENFGVKQEEIVAKYLPRLGFGRNPRVYELYRPLVDLPEPWQEAIIREQVAVETAFLLAGAGEADLAAFLKLIEVLRLGKNRQREFWRLLKDIARMKGGTISDLMNSQELSSIIEDIKMTPAQKTERYKTALWRLRYPRYSKTKAKFDNLLSEAKFPPEIHLQPPPYFEGEKFSFTLTFKTIEELQKELELIRKNITSGVLQKIIDLTC